MKSNVELLAIACEDGTQLFRQFLGQTDLPSDHTENDLASTELYLEHQLTGMSTVKSSTGFWPQ